MRRLSLQGARWHQHAVRRGLLNRARYSNHLPLQRPFSVQGFRYAKDDDHEVKIRYFEQASRKSKNRVEVDPEAEETAEQEELRAKIQKLEEELEVLKEGPYGPNSPFMKSLSKEDREIALKALREHQEEEQKKGIAPTKYEDEDIIDEELDDMIKNEFEGLAKEEEDQWDPAQPIEKEERPPPPKEPFEIELKVPDTHQAYVDRFNNCLKHVSHGSSDSTAKQDLWKWYRRCKQAIPSFVEMIPEETFAMLWDVQFQGKATAASRLNQMQALVDDMTLAGRTLTGPQWLTYLELLHQDDKTEQALKLWETYEEDLTQDPEDT